ncbi:hypothetical protein MXMO3_00030 [Maritalea myrionectae]|uniref:Uncharacterized protein n=1 Tax=Maritalea myrionectae TaxID=454601 RepID=A0A2R4M966_9HYPH|nr:hypothetical protein [Maritalea myrionectae]AVX02578.1 hypothetical protein MXMO3_00030 [Maritalea myrionectae]
MSEYASYDAKVIELTQGNINNDHFYMREACDLIPRDAIGGSNEALAGKPVTVTFVPGGSIDTDFDDEKKFFRRRGPVGEFFKLSFAEAGDFVLVTKMTEREFEVRLLKT